MENKPIVELIRIAETEDGTLGILRVNKDEWFCCTLEPSDEENAQSISSIPAQQYLCGRYSSPKYPHTFEVLGVPGRSKILFHSGNRKKDTAGCILLGQYFGKLQGDRAVLNSGNTFSDFMNQMLGAEVFHLTIKEEF